MAWPVDNAVVLASMCVQDELRGRGSNQVVARWVAQVRARLDIRGSIPHAWDPATGTQGEHTRGYPQALINAFLPLMDSTLAQEHYQLFRTSFFMERSGVPLVREYPTGISGWGDVDPGPVIMGAGCAASILGAAACRANGDLFYA